jgi:hypothetical protein
VTGFVALYREATEHPLFAGDVARFGAWSWLVVKACWKSTRFNISGATITIERGQLCVSRSQLATAWGWSPSAVERFLARLETEQMIGRATGQGRTIITICNYEKYQDVGEQAGQAAEQATGQRSDSHRTTKEQGNKGTIEEEEANASPSSTPAPRKRAAPFVRPDWVPAEPWDAFVAMRIKNRKPMTDHAKTLAVSELAKLAEDGHPPGAVLNQSTFHSWLGLFKIKDQDNGYRTRNGAASTVDAVQRALELTGGTQGREPDGPEGRDYRIGQVPDAVRTLGYVER